MTTDDCTTIRGAVFPRCNLVWAIVEPHVAANVAARTARVAALESVAVVFIMKPNDCVADGVLLIQIRKE
jgi:hypothetical protein